MGKLTIWLNTLLGRGEFMEWPEYRATVRTLETFAFQQSTRAENVKAIQGPGHTV